MSAYDQIELFLRNKIDKGIFTAASVTVGKAGDKPVSVHVGKLSKSVETVVNRHTVFDLQSMTKALVTGPLFLHLNRGGNLKADTRVSEILDSSYPLPKEAAANTELGHLLLHSAGYSDQDMTGNFKTAYDLWQQIFTAKTHYEPGTSIEYADAHYRVLGKAIEVTFGESLEAASRRLLFNGSRSRELGFLPLNPFNVVGCGEAHGTIDDDHVRLLGEIVGCDGLFASSEALFELIASYMTNHSALGEPLGPLLKRHIFAPEAKIENFFDALSKGPKTYGWEVNPPAYSYAGKFKSDTTFEKSGGAGTFIWFDHESQMVCVYLTNYGKPKPFKPKSWNRLIDDLEPQALSNLV